MGTDITVNAFYQDGNTKEAIVLSSNGKTTSSKDFFRNYDAFELLQYDSDLPYCLEKCLGKDDIKAIESIRKRFGALSVEERKLASKDADDYYYGHSVYSLADLKKLVEIVKKALVFCEEETVKASKDNTHQIVYRDEEYSVDAFIEYINTHDISTEDIVNTCLYASMANDRVEQYEYIEGLREDIESILYYLQEVYNRLYYRFIVWYPLNVKNWSSEEEIVIDGLDKVLVYLKFDC